MSARARIATFLVAGVAAWAGPAAPAAALNPVGTLCSAARIVTAGVTSPCSAAKRAKSVITVGGKVLTGHPGAALGAAGSAVASIGLDAIGSWVLGGAKFALNETAKVMGATTRPQLRSTWFSGTYWRMAGIAAVLTLPFLFAAAVQALLRSDLTLLLRAALMHLPLSMLVVSVAAPLTMLLLAAADELSAIVSGAAGDGSGHFLTAASLTIVGLSAKVSPFIAFLIGVFTVAAAVMLWIELLMRETAVYVIVLMLPLAFAAFVWPARRIWAVRTVELLCALILSKFAIVAVLSLGAAALGSSLGHQSVGNWLAGLVLIVMGAFMPWALLRLVPLAEVASSAAGSLRHDLWRAVPGASSVADRAARSGQDWLDTMTSHMRRQAQDERMPGSGDADPAGRDEVGGLAPDPPPGDDERSQARAEAAQDGEDQPRGEGEAASAASGPSAEPAEAEAAQPSAAATQAAEAAEPSAAPPADVRDGRPTSVPGARPAVGSAQAPEPPDELGALATDGPAPGDVTEDPPPARAHWEAELLAAGPMAREIGYGHPTGRHRITRTSKADDPDPLPPAQDRPGGPL